MADELLPFAQLNWLLNEIAKSENPVSIKKNFKTYFKVPLEDVTLKLVKDKFKQDIQELKRIKEEEFSSHELANAKSRLDKLQEIYDMAMEGVPMMNSKGETFLSPKLDSALQALKQSREEEQAKTTYELNMLRLLLQHSQLKVPPLPEGQIEGAEAPLEITIKTDNDEFFDS